jgi:hypothetical protein
VAHIWEGQDARRSRSTITSTRPTLHPQVRRNRSRLFSVALPAPSELAAFEVEPYACATQRAHAEHAVDSRRVASAVHLAHAARSQEVTFSIGTSGTRPGGASHLWPHRTAESELTSARVDPVLSGNTRRPHDLGHPPAPGDLGRSVPGCDPSRSARALENGLTRPEQHDRIDAMDGKPAEGRITSIDALRGFAMFWIIGADSFFTSVLQLSDAPWAKALKHELGHSARTDSPSTT